MGDPTSLTLILTASFDFHQVVFGSEAYKQTCALRNEVLRKPLGLDLFSEDLSQEKDQLHFGMFDRDVGLIACVVAVPQSADAAKIRQMAVRAGFEGQGVGSMLMQALEETLATRGVVKLTLHARVTAAGFYEKLGYVRMGEPFVEVGIPHIRMEKYQSDLNTA